MRLNIILALILLISGCSKDDNESKSPEDYPVEKAILTKVEIIDGSIFVHWNSIKRFNFNWAALIITGDSFYKEILLSEETLKSQVFNDMESTSSTLNYQLELKNEKQTTLSNILTLTSEPFTIKEEYVGFNKLKVTYTKHPLYNNVDYLMYEVDYYDHAEHLSPMGGEFIVDYAFVFGDRIRVKTYTHDFLAFYESGERDVKGNIKKEFKVGTDFESVYYNDIVFDPVTNKYVTLNLKDIGDYQNQEVYLNVFNKEDLKLESSTLITVTKINQRGSLMIDKYSKKIIVEIAGKSLILNNHDFSVAKDCDCNEYLDKPLAFNFKPVYRNNVLVCMEEGGLMSFFNAETKQLKGSVLSTDYFFQISDEADYFFLNNQFYELLEGGIQTIMPSGLPPEAPDRQLIFNSENKTCFAYSRSNYAYKFDLNSRTKANFEEFSDVSHIVFNELRNEYMVGEYHLSFDNYTDASFITLWNEGTNKKRKIQVFDDHNGNFYKYVNDKIFFSRGQYLDQSWLSY